MPENYALPRLREQQGGKADYSINAGNASIQYQDPRERGPEAFGAAFDRTYSVMEKTREVLEDREKGQRAQEAAQMMDQELQSVPQEQEIAKINQRMAQLDEAGLQGANDPRMVLEKNQLQTQLARLSGAALTQRASIMQRYAAADPTNKYLQDGVGKRFQQDMETRYKPTMELIEQQRQTQEAWTRDVQRFQGEDKQRLSELVTSLSKDGSLSPEDEARILQEGRQTYQFAMAASPEEQDQFLDRWSKSALEFNKLKDFTPQEKRQQEIEDRDVKEAGATERSKISASGRRGGTVKQADIKAVADRRLTELMAQNKIRPSGVKDVYLGADGKPVDITPLRDQANKEAESALGGGNLSAIDAFDSPSSSKASAQPSPDEAKAFHSQISDSLGRLPTRAEFEEAWARRDKAPEQAAPASQPAPAAGPQSSSDAPSREEDVLKAAKAELAKGSNREWVEKWMQDQGVHPSRLQDSSLAKEQPGRRYQRLERPPKDEGQSRPQAQRASRASQVSLDQTLSQAAESEGVPVEIARAVMQAESGGRISARSNKGAIGLMQLMPDTAKDLGVDPHDPAQNIAGGVRYLKQMYDRFGSWKLAISAYNSGPGAVEKHGGVPPFKETKNYLARINRLLA